VRKSERVGALLLTPAQAAAELGTTPAQLAAEAAAGRGPAAYAISSTVVRYSPEAVAQYRAEVSR
jgi:hypothetical protein